MDWASQLRLLLEKLVIGLLAWFGARKELEHEQTEKELQAVKRVAAAPDGDGMPVDEVLAEFDRRKQRRSL